MLRSLLDRGCNLPLSADLSRLRCDPEGVGALAAAALPATAAVYPTEMALAAAAAAAAGFMRPARATAVGESAAAGCVGASRPDWTVRGVGLGACCCVGSK